MHHLFLNFLRNFYHKVLELWTLVEDMQCLGCLKQEKDMMSLLTSCFLVAKAVTTQLSFIQYNQYFGLLLFKRVKSSDSDREGFAKLIGSYADIEGLNFIECMNVFSGAPSEVFQLKGRAKVSWIFITKCIEKGFILSLKVKQNMVNLSLIPSSLKH